MPRFKFEVIEEVRMVRINYRSIRPFKGLIMIIVPILILLTSWQTGQAIPNGGYSRPELIIQPEELKVLIDKKDPDIRIIDIREKLKYLAGHISGAIHIWRPDIEDRNHPIPGMMAPQAQIEDLMGGVGISDRSMIIVYSDGPDNGRLWWILAYYGFPLNQMRILDGGIDGWRAKGYPTEMIPPKVEKGFFKLLGKVKEREPILCTLPDIRSAQKSPGKVVLDVRTQKEFLGEETRKGASRPGRIPGVIWIEWTEALVEEGPYKGYWRSAEEIRKIFSVKGITPDKDIYIY